MGKEVLCIIVLFLILMPFVSAISEVFVQTQDDAILIEYPKIFVLKQNNDFHVRFHAFNKTDGKLLTNETINCTFNLYNSFGEGILRIANLNFGVPEGAQDCQHCFGTHIDGGNFSTTGSYSYLIRCDNVAIGGAVSVGIEVTPTGMILTESDSMIYIFLTLGSLFFFLLCLYGGIALPFRNQRSDEQKIISVQKLKYFKVGLLFLSYVFFVWLLNLFLTLSTNFSILTQYTKFFEVIFSVTNSASYPIFVFMLILMSILAWKDLALKKLLLRGINPS